MSVRTVRVSQPVFIRKGARKYEDCAIMRDLMKRYHIDERDEIQDWQAEIWRCGYSGEIAVINFPYYMHEAVKW